MDINESERQWAAGVEGYVLGNLPDRPARVLEVGCGAGELAVAMDRAGYQVTAVDPEAPEGPIFRRTTIEELQDLGPFDAVVVSLALHHVADPGKVLDRCLRLLVPDGRVIVVEYAWERFDDTAARWYVERRCHDPAEPGWLENRYQAWLQARAGGETAGFSRWHQRRSEEEGIHEGAFVLRELRDRFVERSLAWGPYLYLDLGAPEADEVQRSRAVSCRRSASASSGDAGERPCPEVLIAGRAPTCGRCSTCSTRSHPTISPGRPASALGRGWCRISSLRSGGCLPSPSGCCCSAAMPEPGRSDAGVGVGVGCARRRDQAGPVGWRGAVGRAPRPAVRPGTGR